MSEFQYYEFRALDRPLTAKQQEELEELSSRAEIDAHSFINEYSYGNFRGDPDDMMKRYFDAHLYMANWGTNKLMLRLPRGEVDEPVIHAYLDSCEVCGVAVTDDHVIVTFEGHDEGGRWIETDGVLDTLLPLREQIMAGDYRCLYLGWLSDVHGMNSYSDDDEKQEPPVPPGLGQIDKDKALSELVDFLYLNEDLVSVAAETSPPLAKGKKQDDSDLLAWLAQQPAAQKEAWLLELVTSEDATPRRRILKEFRRATAGPKPVAAAGRRTLGEIRALEETTEERRVAGEKAKREAASVEAERKRKVYLDALVGQEDRLWGDVQTLIDTKKPDSYDAAVKLLIDLRDLARREQQEDAFRSQMEQLKARHASKTAFTRRLAKAELLDG